MTKTVLNDLANLENLTAVSIINANNAVIETAFDNTLSRDGTIPNQMEAVLDMNSHRIINLPAADTADQPVRKAEFDLITNGYTGNNILLGTSHEVNVTSSGGTSTFSLPSTLTFTGKTVTNGTYTTPVLTTPSMSGTPDANTSKFIADGANIINASDHGVGTGVSDNGIPLNTLITSLPDGSTILLPYGVLNFTTTIRLTGKTAFTLKGKGGLSAGVTAGTSLFYQGTGTAIEMGSGCINCYVDSIQLFSQNPTFPGTFIRCGNTSGTDPQMNGIRNCILSAQAGTAIDLDKCIEFYISDCFFGGFVNCISGCFIPSSYSGIVSIERCQFAYGNGGAYIRNPGSTWKMDTCTFEHRLDGTGVAVLTDVGYSTYGMTFINCWFGDVTTSGGIWISNYGGMSGLEVTGCSFGGAGPGTSNSAIAVAVGDGIVVKGNFFNGFSTAISITNSQMVDLSPNSFLNCGVRVTTPGAANPGFHFLPNGMLMQYGSSVVTTGTPLVVTFSVPFSDAPFNVQATLSTPVGSNTVYSTLITPSTMDLNVNGTAGTSGVHWMAIGKKEI